MVSVTRQNEDNIEVVVEDVPLMWCSDDFSHTVAADRLDAGAFVKLGYVRRTIETGQYPAIPIAGNSGLTVPYVRPRFKRIWVEESDYPIFQPSSVTDINPAPDGYISPLTHTDIEALRVSKGQVLMTCSGSVGSLAYVSTTLDGYVFSHDLLRIDCNDADDAGYVYAYLKNDIGKNFLVVNHYGTTVTHIEPKHLENIPIPNAPAELRKKINDLIVRSYDLRDESNEIIEKATRLLIKELKLPPLGKLGDKASVWATTIKLSELSDRLDAGYHAPLADAVEECLRQNAGELTTIGDSRVSEKVILPGRFKRVYVDEGQGRTFIGSKQIGELDPSNKKYLSYSYHGKQIKALELHENMTLITCSGTIGRIAFVSRHWEKWTASQHMIRVVPASEDIAGYLYVFLASDYGHQLITRCSYGAVVQEIDDSHVRQVPFPLLKNAETQKRINDLALLANEKRYEAYCLEQEALEVMDKEIIYAK